MACLFCGKETHADYSLCPYCSNPVWLVSDQRDRNRGFRRTMKKAWIIVAKGIGYAFVLVLMILGGG